MEIDRATVLRPEPGRRVAYRCSSCGYGIAVAGPVPACPMCGGRDWQPEPWRPFSRLLTDPLRQREPEP